MRPCPQSVGTFRDHSLIEKDGKSCWEPFKASIEYGVEEFMGFGITEFRIARFVCVFHGLVTLKTSEPGRSDQAFCGKDRDSTTATNLRLRLGIGLRSIEMLANQNRTELLS